MSAIKPVALITGGARGIGRAIARHLVSSRWQVSIIDLPDSGLHRTFARERHVFAIEGVPVDGQPTIYTLENCVIIDQRNWVCEQKEDGARQEMVDWKYHTENFVNGKPGVSHCAQ